MTEQTQIGPDLDVDAFLAECLALDPLELNDAMAKFPGQLYYWGAKYTEALEEHLNAEVALKRTKARLTLSLREQLTTTKPVEAKKGAGSFTIEKVVAPTVDQVAAAVENHGDFLRAQLQAVEAEANKARAFAVLDAMRAKREMLVSLGAQQRAEMNFDPLVREQHALRRDQQRQAAP